MEVTIVHLGRAARVMGQRNPIVFARGAGAGAGWQVGNADVIVRVTRRVYCVPSAAGVSDSSPVAGASSAGASAAGAAGGLPLVENSALF